VSYVYIMMFAYPCVDIFTRSDSVVCLHNNVCLSLCRHISHEFINMIKRVFRKNAHPNLQWCATDEASKTDVAVYIHTHNSLRARRSK
jgi:hypothetical protein